MKPKRTQKPSAPQYQGKGEKANDKSQAKQTSVPGSSVKVKPFVGKVFYLDLPSNRGAETLERDIKELGGTVEKFFSKEIRYLVSNKREARYVHCFRQDSPVPSPESGPSSPQPRSNPNRPGANSDTTKTKTQGQTESLVKSRGKSLVERVVKGQERVQINKILSKALEWGVKILYVDDIVAYVLKKKKMVNCQRPAVKTSVKAETTAKHTVLKSKGGRLSKPFVKVEDSSKHYRPIYLTVPDVPEFNLKSVAPYSPFYGEEKDLPGNRQRGQRGAKASASEEKAHGRRKNKDKKRGGYCECCSVKYDNLKLHLQSESHRTFSKSEEYSVVDRLISTLPCSFIPKQTQVKRQKFSVSTDRIFSGPCRETDLRPDGDLQPSDTVEDLKNSTVHGSQRSYSGHNINVASGYDPSSHRKEPRRNFYTHSGRSKQKYVARKRPCKKKPLISSKQKEPKPEQIQVPLLNLEAAHSSEDFFPPREPRKHTNVSISLLPDRDVRHNVSSRTQKSSSATGRAESEWISDTMLFDARDGNMFPEKVPEKHLSEKEEEILPLQTASGERIQRKIRFYKHKRRKVDTQVEPVKPSESPDDSTLTLWQLFQSSDDMEEEFCGFEDEEGTN